MALCRIYSQTELRDTARGAMWMGCREILVALACSVVSAVE